MIHFLTKLPVRLGLRLSLLLLVFAIIPITSYAIIIHEDLPITGDNTPYESPDFNIRFVEFLRRFQIPGAAVAIMKNGEIVLSHGYGWADSENQIPVQPHSLFRVASVSKAITAVAILHLIEQGKLKLDTKVFNELEGIAPLNDMTAKSHVQQITVRNLLQMSSGWYTSGPRNLDVMFGPWPSRITHLLNDQVPPDCITATRLMMALPTHFTPGTKYSYSNVNYCMLGLILNRVTGFDGNTGYEAYVQQQILQPLGINDMHLGDTAWENRDFNEVKYYTYASSGSDTEESNLDGLPYSNSQILKKNYADGGWVASAVSLAKFTHALGNNRILSPSMIQAMITKPSFQTKVYNYFGMGWTVKYIHGHRYFLKTGSFTGTSALIVQGDDGTSYAALFNAKPFDRARFYNQLESILFSYR
jgi:N-acyl-D-amino-acid deacylase